MLFLFLAYKTQDLCNLTLSYSLFEKFTGCLSLLEYDFRRLPKPDATIGDPLRDELLSYLKCLFEPTVEPLYTPLDTFIVNFIFALIKREEENGTRISREYLRKNIWAYNRIYRPREPYEGNSATHPDIILCEPDGLLNDDLLELLDMWKTHEDRDTLLEKIKQADEKIKKRKEQLEKYKQSIEQTDS